MVSPGEMRAIGHGVPTVLVDGVPLFSGAIRAVLMEAELRKAAGHVRN
jgi:hypothetical protein